MTIALALGGCSVFQKAPTYRVGMEESDFLKLHDDAVISGLDGNQKTYRVKRDDQFYLLATFEDEKLIKLEEKEIYPSFRDNFDMKNQIESTPNKKKN